MKLIRYPLLSALSGILLVASSCSEKFVDLAPPTTIRQDQYFKTQSDINAALNGAYGGLRSYYDQYFVLTEIPSDNAESNPGTDAGYGVFDRLNWLTTTGQISTYWTSSYSIISRCNILLGKIDGVSMDATLKERFKGEAKFLRALMYFNLVRFFGDVPLVLKEIETEAEAYSYNRDATSQIYEQITQDLMDARKVLPTSYTGTDIGRATSGAAKALLGKAYLTNQQFSQAVAILKEVVDANTYSLLSTYADVFRPTNGNNAEIIFAVQYTRTGNKEGSNFAFNFAPVNAADLVGTGGAGSGQNQGTIDLFNAFEAGDLRKDISIRQYPNGVNPFYTSKFLEQPPTTNEGEADWPLLRYSDMLLMYAEALNEVNQTTAALVPLNQVRKRAGLPAKTGLTQTDFRLAVEQERRVELCFEGHRWFDLIRTGRLVPVMNAYVTKYKTTGYQVNGYQVAANKALYPIPFREVNLNTNLTQNPGY